MNAQTKQQHYIPKLQLGARVRVVRGVGSGPELAATVIRALENPSQRAENQWYDVKFDGGRLGRFQATFLKPISKT